MINLLVAVSWFIVASAASADVTSFQLVATPTAANTTTPGFTVGFSDVNGDNLFEISEKTSFDNFGLPVATGVYCYCWSVAAVPDIAGIASAAGSPGLYPSTYWFFLGSHAPWYLLSATDFTYVLTAAPVPEPSPTWLAAVAGGWLWSKRRRLLVIGRRS